MSTPASTSDTEVLPGLVPEPVPDRNRWVLALVLAACAVPLVAAAVAVATKGWTPVGEFAQAELRVRDIWAHPPSLGAVGRLRTPTDVSSHPGPIAWYAMYPTYALFGRSAAGLAASVAVAAWVWAAAAISLAWRRGGDALAVLLGIGVLGLFAGLGPISFVEPWNPWFALLPLLAVAIATWAVLDRSAWALVMVVVGATYCVQAHFGFLPIVGALGAVALGGFLWGSRRTLLTAKNLTVLGTAIGVGVVLWIPPLVQQLSGDPGNISVIIDAYRLEAGQEAELGLVGALKLLAAFLDPLAITRLLDGPLPTSRGADLGSVVVAAAWIAAAVLAWRGRTSAAMARAGKLLAVASVGVLASVIAAAQIPGEVFGYLILFLVVLLVVQLVAIAWVGWVWLAERPSGQLRYGPAIGLAVLAAATVGTGVEFARTEVPASELSAVEHELASEVGEHLADVSQPGDRWLVRWDDPLAFGALGTGLASELERQGFDVGVDDYLRVEMRPHRVLAESDASGVLMVVTGAAIEDWEDLASQGSSPVVAELARVEPRTDAEIERSVKLRRQVRAQLEELGGADLADQLDENYWVARSDPRVGPDLRAEIDELSTLGLPTAVFLVEPGTAQP